jgi:hypothetical protein
MYEMYIIYYNFLQNGHEIFTYTMLEKIQLNNKSFIVS